MPQERSQPAAASAWAGVGFQVDRCGSSRNGIACACTEEVVTAAALTPPQWQASGCLLAAVSLAVLAAVHVTLQTPVNLVGSWFTPNTCVAQRSRVRWRMLRWRGMIGGFATLPHSSTEHRRLFRSAGKLWR